MNRPATFGEIAFVAIVIGAALNLWGWIFLIYATRILKAIKEKSQ